MTATNSMAMGARPQISSSGSTTPSVACPWPKRQRRRRFILTRRLMRGATSKVRCQSNDDNLKPLGNVHSIS